MVLDMKLLKNFKNILIFERKPIICDDRHGYTILTNDVIEDDRGDLLSHDLGKQNGFDPLCKLFCGGNDEFVTIG